jgi:pyruvate/2-oxoglutarate dehydrogenase complex dihydrolipoamide dehydrogenase (E3) component
MEHYGCIVIGAGQGGGPLAGAFARRGHRTMLVERAALGGSCVNVGCTPTKALVASARVAALARAGAAHGIDIGALQVNLAATQARTQRIVHSFRRGSANGLEAAGVEVVYGSAQFAGPRTVRIETASGPFMATAEHVIISTGLRPARPDIPGIDHTPVLDSTALLELDALPAHLIVLGAGFVGLEFAQMFRRFGSAVTVVDPVARLVPNEDPDIAEALQQMLSDDGIDFVLDHDIEALAETGSMRSVVVRSRRDQSVKTLAGSHLLLAAGRRPNTEGLGLTDAGVETDARGFVVVNAMLETTAPGVYAIGDVKGGPAFTHVAYDDFRILRANLLDGEARRTTGRMVPYTLFTDPQLGRIGLTETAARAMDLEVDVYRLPMAHVARAIEMGETRGLMKAVVDRATDQILGAAVLGVEGGELVTVLQMAMMGRLPAAALRDMIFPHPTMAESLNNLFGTRP